MPAIFLAEAVSWFLRAAKAAHAESYLGLARLYENRELEVYSRWKPTKWFQVAVEYSEGHSTSALFAISRQYIQGVGAPCDLQMAKWWLNRILFVSPSNSASKKERNGC